MDRILLMAYLLLAAIATAQIAPAGRSTEQEGAVVERLTAHARFENDGTSVRETTAAIRIQSEAGVQQYGQLVFGYSSATEELKVDYVRVRKITGEIVETPESNAQDFAPEILQSAPMYSDYRQRHITVVRLRPGDVLEYRTMTRERSLAPGDFWFEYSFPKDRAVSAARLQIDVPKGRALRIKSPKHKYAVAESGDRQIYTWTVQDFVPERKTGAEDDDDAGEDEFENAPDVQVSTFADWQQVARWYARLQGERVVVDDAVRARAAELTRGAATPMEKARRIYDFVARDFRYVSLSFGVGRYQPHAATEVLKGGYGDCKDKHTLLAALLRAAGIPSYPVLIGAGRKLDPEIPSPAQFNHVISQVQLGREALWLDTTTEVAPFGLILYDLRNKLAVVAAEDAHGGLQRTPASSPVKNSLLFSVDGKVSETGTLDATIDLTATGDTELPLRATFRSLPRAEWKRLARVLWFTPGSEPDVSDITVGPVEDTSKPFHLRYRVRQENYFRVPSTNASFFPFSQLPFRPLRKPDNRPEPLDVGPALELTHRMRLEFPENFTLRFPTEIRMSRDYADYSSSMRLTNRIFEAERKLVVKVSAVPPSRRADVESLRSVAGNVAAQTVFCSIRPASRAAQTDTKPATDKPEDLRKAGLRALQQRDFAAASQLFKRVVEQDAKNANAWDDLGRAYAGLNSNAEAIAAFKKQIEINPYHKTAYVDLGAELERQGQYEEAAEAYRKQLEQVPLDRTARKSLGLLLAQLRRDREAIAQLEEAVSIPPDDPEVTMALAELYLRSGSAEKGRALMTKVVGSASALPSADLYAAALADDLDGTQSLKDARKVLDDIAEQFDVGAFAGDASAALPAMRFVALSWARIGWAKASKGETLEGLRYLEAAWLLTQSGTIADRMAHVYRKAGQLDQAKRMLGLACAVGGAQAESRCAELVKLDAAVGERTIAQARAELSRLHSQTVRAAAKSGTAEFELVFDGADKPERVTFRGGDAGLRSAEEALLNSKYPVMFPDFSSIKLVRRGILSCTATGCSLSFKPIDAAPQAAGSEAMRRPD